MNKTYLFAGALTLPWLAACGADMDTALSIPAGAFVQGCEPGEPTCGLDESPARTVQLAAFTIDRTEVTQRAWAQCVDDGTCPVPACVNGAQTWTPDETPQHPVVCVTWTQAQDYCAWAGQRLPTEAEWEKAARGTDGAAFPWGDAEPDCDRANARSCGGQPRPVGSQPAGASPFGALDMAGNVCEWVADWYQEDYYAAAPDSDPRGPQTGTARVVRDGNYLLDFEYSRGWTRHYVDPEIAQPVIGFRCAQDADAR